MSKPFAVIAAVVAAVLIVAGLFYFVDVDQTREARLPDVDVQVEGGQLPDYDVKTGSVTVGTEEAEVKVPDVDVKMEEKTIKVPTINVEPAPAD